MTNEQIYALIESIVRSVDSPTYESRHLPLRLAGLGLLTRSQIARIMDGPNINGYRTLIIEYQYAPDPERSK